MTRPAPVRTVLLGGLVADGSGGPPRHADVILEGGSIEALVPVSERPASYDAKRIDCTGRVVAPGFIDIHCHSDISLLAYPDNASRVTQGVTTEVVGNCGMSPAPGNADSVGLKSIISTIDVTPKFPWSWTDVATWLAAYDQTPTATNVATQIGHGSARFAVAGTSTRSLDADEMAALDHEVEAAFDAGVLGASVGLMYAPGEAATSEEFDRLAHVVARRQGVLSAHLRDYRTSRAIDAIDELAIPIARTGGRLQISHLRAIGNEPGFEAVLEHVEQLRSSGIDVAADLYPYVHGHTTLLQLLPSELRSAGPTAALEACQRDPAGVAAKLRGAGYANEQIVIMKAARTPSAVGSDLNMAPVDPYDWLVHLLVANNCLVDVAVESGRWEDVDAAYDRPWVYVASDGTALDAAHDASAPHPRSWGAFSAAWRRLRDRGVPVGEVVRRMTTGPAARVGIRSGVAPGLRADIAIVDDARFDSTASFAQPASASTGVVHVFVNGVAVVESGHTTGERPGVLIRKGSNV